MTMWKLIVSIIVLFLWFAGMWFMGKFLADSLKQHSAENTESSVIWVDPTVMSNGIVENQQDEIDRYKELANRCIAGWSDCLDGWMECEYSGSNVENAQYRRH